MMVGNRFDEHGKVAVTGIAASVLLVERQGKVTLLRQRLIGLLRKGRGLFPGVKLRIRSNALQQLQHLIADENLLLGKTECLVGHLDTLSDRPLSRHAPRRQDFFGVLSRP